MKRFVLLIIILLSISPLYSQTRPNWRQMADPPMTLTTSTVASSLNWGSILVLEEGGFVVPSGATFTVDVPFNAGLYPIFSGAGNVVFEKGTVEEIPHVWFGNSAAGVNAALRASSNIPVRITNSITVEETISIESLDNLYMDDSIELTAVDYASLTTPMILASGSTLFNIRGGNLNGLGSTQTGTKPCLSIINCSNAVLENIKINNTGFTGTDGDGAIYVYNSSEIDILNCISNNAFKFHNIFVLESSYVRIDNCMTEQGVAVNDSNITVNFSPYCSVTNSTCVNSTGSHISFNSQYGRVKNNMCTAGAQTVGWGITIGANDVGLDEYRGSNTVVSGNTTIGMSLRGINVEGTTTEYVSVLGNFIEGDMPSSHVEGRAGIGVTASNTIVTGNIIINCDEGIFVKDTSGKGCTIMNNIVSSSYGHGISLDSDRNIVSGNRVINNGLGAADNSGIYVGIPSDNNCITGNICYDDQASQTQDIGIEVLTSSNLIRDNFVAGNITYGVSAIAGNLVNDNYIYAAIGEVNNYTPLTFADVANPNVFMGDFYLTGGTTTITTLRFGYAGQRITILAKHSVTIKQAVLGGENIYINGAADYTMTTGDTLVLVKDTADKWYEVSRSVN